MPEVLERPTRVPAPRAGRRAARDTAVFRAAMALVALAVIDDAFLHPEPGTSAGDHVASGLVPLAAALALALAYPGLRAGAKGAITIVCGILALTAGLVDGFRHVALDGMAGDDLTVMAGGAAGVVLLALGAVTLWRSRRRDERPWRRYARRTVIAVVAGLAGLFVLLPVAIAVVATHRARAPIARADLGRPYVPVTFATADGLRLAGWYVPSRNRAAVIVSPGRKGPVGHARMLARHGYGVLLFDRRGEGQSQGDFNAYGWGGDADLQAAAAFLARRPDVDASRIGGLGLSVGGEMLLQAAAQDTRIRAAVAEGASVRSIAEEWDDPGVATIRKPFAPMVVQTVAVAVLANRAPPPSLMELVGRIAPRPVLLVRGLDGQRSEVLNREFYRRAGRPKELWEVPGARHTGALTAQPRDYERRVVAFFDRALLSGGKPLERSRGG